MKKSLYAINTVLFIGMILVNVLANTTLLGGMTTGAVSDAYPNLFAPAGYTFSIWGIIYIMLGAFVVYQWVAFRRSNVSLDYFEIGPWFALSCVLNIVWLFSWQYQIMWLTVILMVLLLLTLIVIYQRVSHLPLTHREALFLKVPFSLYFGWITIATIANFATFFVSIGFTGGDGAQVWMVLILFVGVLIGSLVIWRTHDFVYAAVPVWAYIGILSKHISASGWNGRYPAVIVCLVVCLILFAVVITTTAVRLHAHSRPAPRNLR